MPAGTLHLHVGLSAAAGGTEVGAVDTTFEGGVAAAPLIVRMRETPTDVVMSPSSVPVSVGATKPLYAALHNSSDGAYIFSAPTVWSWSSDVPTVATVGSTGLVSGVAVGNATIRANYLPVALSGTATASVTANGVTKGKWTIMVYMDAANDLYPFAPKNINQMESIANNPDVRFVIQWKQVRGVGGNTNPSFSGTRRYLAQYDSASLTSTSNTIKSVLAQDLGSGVDMAAPAALADFVNWTKSKYPADHYALVLWSHGGGWYSARSKPFLAEKTRAIIYDEETNNYLSLPDVSNALDDGSLDVMAYDACLMQGAEDYVELASKTKTIVASEDNVPGTGLPYQLVFKPFVSALDTATSTLAVDMVNAYVNEYRNSNAGFPIQMSALDTSKVGAFNVALDNLGLALLSDPGATTAVPAVRAASSRIEPGDGYYYYDLTGIATGLASQSGLSASTKAAATSLSAAVANATLATSTDTPSLQGMSVEFARSGTFSGYAVGYGNLRLSALTHWNEFLASGTANP